MSWRFTVRKKDGRTPDRPRDSFLRRGYARTPKNPRGEHRGTDIPMPVGTIKQAPVKARINWKGWFGDLGRVIELELLEGYDKGRFLRFCHCEMYTDLKTGKWVAAGYAVARIGMTGRTTGPHDHEEMGRYPLKRSRDPRWNITERLRDAWDHRRW